MKYVSQKKQRQLTNPKASNQIIWCVCMCFIVEGFFSDNTCAQVQELYILWSHFCHLAFDTPLNLVNTQYFWKTMQLSFIRETSPSAARVRVLGISKMHEGKPNKCDKKSQLSWPQTTLSSIYSHTLHLPSCTELHLFISGLVTAPFHTSALL